MRSCRKAARGVTLIEALVSLMIVSLGMVTLMGLQTSLRRSADLSRQRGEALRLAQQDIETLRAYSLLEKAAPVNSAQDFASIAGTERTIHADNEGANAQYTLTRQVSSSDNSRLKSIHTTVSWSDRAGNTQQITLDSLIFGIDPSLGASLGIAPDPASTSRPGGRIPLSAKDLRNGTSAYKPDENDTVVWIFNNLNAVVTSVCTVPAGVSTSALRSADFSHCRNISPENTIPRTAG